MEVCQSNHLVSYHAAAFRVVGLKNTKVVSYESYEGFTYEWCALALATGVIIRPALSPGRSHATRQNLALRGTSTERARGLIYYYGAYRRKT